MTRIRQPLLWSPGGGRLSGSHVLELAAGAGSALGAVTHLGVVAHADDLEIGCIHGILECFGRPDRGFFGIVTCDGRGSARSGPYADTSDEEMRRLRREEQLQAAGLGGYAGVVQLDFRSHDVRQRLAPLGEELKGLLELTRPEVVYTHSPLDRHETHMAVAAATLQAVRALSPAVRPQRLLGCEVWGSLDALEHPDRVELDASSCPELQQTLLSVFDSQIAGGKGYDRATLGRRRAQATFGRSHQTDERTGVVLALDLSRLVADDSISLLDYAERILDESKAQMLDRLRGVCGEN